MFKSYTVKKNWLLIILLIASVACKKSKKEDAPPVTPPVTTEFFKGADISWITEMEAAGKKFYNNSGAEQECTQLLKSLGMNAIRLRVWVNPANGWNNTADVILKATRAKNLGMKILLDFHYSDSWADPGQQTKPAAWAAQDFATLVQSVSAHTTSVLNAMKAANVTPTWVQIGNETNDGMLWPDGKASTNMNKFAQLLNAGSAAVKAVDNSIQVIVHLSNGYDNNLFRWMFDGLTSNSVQYDIIGMSLYPGAADWNTLNTQCLSNMNDMVARYDKKVMVVEIGMSWTEASACNAFIADLINKVKSVNGGKGLGVFYWEPEAYNNWQGYSLGAFDNSGKPTSALSAFN